MKTKITLLLALFFSLYSFGQTVGDRFANNGINYIVTKATLPYEVAVGVNTTFVGAATIPSTVSNSGNSFMVTSIGNSAFTQCTGLTSVTIPNSVMSIGNRAFAGCTALTSVSIPDSVTSISEFTFDYCPSLTSVTIPNSITSIGNSTFRDCSSLTSVTIPNSVTSIGYSAFYRCTGLTSVSIPNSVTSIGREAFTFCTGLTSVSLPNSITSIGSFTFGFCTGLTSVTIPNSVTTIGVTAFSDCSGLTSVTLPNSVTSIGVHAFSRCPSLTSIIIPNSVTSIGDNAFYECTGLTLVTVDWQIPLTINANVFEGVPAATVTLNVPAGTEIAYNSTLGWTDFRIVIPDSIINYCKGEFAQPLVAPFTAGSTLKWYTFATGGTASLIAPTPSTTAAGTKKYYVSIVVEGIESARETITVTINASPTVPGTISTSDAVLCKYIGTTNEVTYAVPAVAGTTYNWSTPAGVNIIADASATDNSITVNFLGASTSTSVGGIGTISVSAVNSNGCASAPRSLVLTSKLPIAPASLILTSADTALDFNVLGVPTSLSSLDKITKVGPYIRTNTVFILTAPAAPTADHYRWELPAGINSFGTTTTVEGVISSSPTITVNFANVNAGTEPLVIKVYSVGGCGESTARILNLTRVLPTAPTKLTLADAGIALTKVGAYTGKTTPLTLTATPVLVQGATATSYSWVLPSGVNVVSGATQVADNGTTKTYSGTATVLTINLGGITTGVLSIPMNVFAVNGTGTSATARKLTLTSAAPATPGAITTPLLAVPKFNPTCATSTTITVQVPAVAGATYAWTVAGVPVDNGGSNSIVINVAGVTTTTLSVSVVASNGTGTSLPRTLAIGKTSVCSAKIAPETADTLFDVIAYPNPSSSEFTLEVQSSSKGATGVQVYDMAGRLIENLQSNSNSVQVGKNYATGVYNVIVSQGTNVKKLRVIKK